MACKVTSCVCVCVCKSSALESWPKLKSVVKYTSLYSTLYMGILVVLFQAIAKRLCTMDQGTTGYYEMCYLRGVGWCNLERSEVPALYLNREMELLLLPVASGTNSTLFYFTVWCL